MSTNKEQPSLLSVPQQADIHLNHSPTGKAIDTIVEYINKTVTPPQGTRIKKRNGNRP